MQLLFYNSIMSSTVRVPFCVAFLLKDISKRFKTEAYDCPPPLLASLYRMLGRKESLGASTHGSKGVGLYQLPRKHLVLGTGMGE